MIDRPGQSCPFPATNFEKQSRVVGLEPREFFNVLWINEVPPTLENRHDPLVVGHDPFYIGVFSIDRLLSFLLKGFSRASLLAPILTKVRMIRIGDRLV